MQTILTHISCIDCKKNTYYVWKIWLTCHNIAFLASPRQAYNLEHLIKIYTCIERTLKTPLKYGLHADRITLWAFIFCPSQVKVTSTRSSEHLRDSRAVTILEWKSVHLRHNASAMLERKSLNVVNFSILYFDNRNFRGVTTVKTQRQNHNNDDNKYGRQS